MSAVHQHLPQSASVSVARARRRPPVAASVTGDEYEIITDLQQIEALAPEWAALWQRAHADYLLTSPDWARISQRIPPDARVRRLICVVARRNGRLDLVWPFVVYRNNLWRVAVPLSSEWGDYSGVLVEDGPDADARVAAAWETLRHTCRCDLISLSFVRENSVLARLVGRDTGPKVALHELEAPWASLAGHSWQSYWASRSARERNGFARKRRRLEEGGALTIEEIHAPRDAAPVLEWLIEAKKVWLAKSGRPDKIRLQTDEFRRFLSALADTLMPEGRCALSVLRQGQTILAADLNLIDKARVEWYVGTFHPDYARFTPGQILKEHCLRWACERGLDYDMRLGGGQHKHFWANRVEPTTTWRLANSPWGAAYVWMKQGLAASRGQLGRLSRLRPASAPASGPGLAISDPPSPMAS
jgi:CelD/BcsL family acetyltransferase involved in cellulose biosynthesis